MKKIYLLLFTSLLTSITMGQNIAFEQVLPLPPAPQNIADFAWVYLSSIAFADIDNDNDQDVLITGDHGINHIIAKLYINDGSGNYEEVIGTTFDGVEAGSIAFTDIDNDNDQDVLITGKNSSEERIAKLYTDDGSGIFAEVTGTPFDGVMYSSIAFSDIDNDNDQDVLITGENSSGQRIAILYTNDGNGIFAEVTGTPFDGVYGSSIAFSDIDNDNDQDLLITGENSSGQRIAKLYINDGSGNFAEVTSTPFDGVRGGSIAFADIDNDNDQDVLITGENSSEERIAKLYTNDGNGFFAEVTGTPFDGVSASSIAFADIDNDNDQDVLITGSISATQPKTKLYTNNGSGNYEATWIPFDDIRFGSIAFADIDNDDDQDVLITGFRNFGPITKLYINDGTGNFAEVTGTPFDRVYNSSIAFADIDNDNDQDVLITGKNSSNQRTAKLYINDGSGNYEVTGTPFDGVMSGSISFADIDNDNDQDVLITGDHGQLIAKLYANYDGSGSFIEVAGTSFEGVEDGSIAFADIDNDNDQDVLITGKNSSEDPIAKLYINNGNSNFSFVPGTPFDVVMYSSIAFADIDNDNDQDVLITGWGSSVLFSTKLYTNDGNGNFAEVMGIPFDGVMSGSIAFADIDNDNDQDVLITGHHYSGPITKLYINDGNGNFTEVTGTPFDGVSYGSIAFADIDNDNDQDVLITGKNSSEERIAKLYTNDGSGIFTEVTGMPFDGVYYSSIAFADIDNDNDQDVLITGANIISQPSAILYRNITVSTGGLEGNTLFNSVSIFPNPAKNKISISTMDGLIIKEINIYNQVGQRVIHKKGKTNTIDVSMLRQGMYIVELEIDKGKVRSKLIIE